jgi:hypothetical protein
MSPQPPTPDVVRRLAFIRVLLARAQEDAAKAAPYSFDSINRLHDAAEMFLALAVQQHHLSIPRDFAQYWDVLAPALGRPLAYRAQMQRFNKVRVNLKHYGVEPAPGEIMSAGVSVRGLLQDECYALFGVELDEVSLTSFVTCEPARRLLESAEARWTAGGSPEAFTDLAEAFDLLIRDYERRKMVGSSRSVFDSAADMRFLTGFFRRLEGKEREFADKVIKSLQALDSTVMLVGLGVDFRRYGKFRALTPAVSNSLSGRRVVHERSNMPSRGEADFEFCRDFVVGTAIHLGDFDYDLADVRSRPIGVSYVVVDDATRGAAGHEIDGASGT